LTALEVEDNTALASLLTADDNSFRSFLTNSYTSADCKQPHSLDPIKVSLMGLCLKKIVFRVIWLH
jgi:hypothetical protein